MALNYAVEQRHRFIEVMLVHYGSISRGVIEEYFGVSSVQASHDIRDYVARQPDRQGVLYAPSTKSWRATSLFERLYA